jgi:hypothetical protein
MNWCQSPAAGSTELGRLTRDNPGITSSDAGRGGGAVRVRGDGADGDCVFPASYEQRAFEDLWQRGQSRPVIGSLRSAGFIASGPRSPTPGGPYTYVTTKHFLSAFGMETLRDLPDMEALEDAGLLSRNGAQSEPLSVEPNDDDLVD